MGSAVVGRCDRTGGNERICVGGGQGNAREQSDAAVSAEMTISWVIAGCFVVSGLDGFCAVKSVGHKLYAENKVSVRCWLRR